MKLTCKICGREYEEHLGEACPFCRREREWEKLKVFVRQRFPKGIRKSLNKYYHVDSRNYVKIRYLADKLYQEEDNVYKSIFLYGETGEGKTTFACALTEEILKRMFILGDGYFEYRPLYTVYDFFCLLKESYSTMRTNSEKSILEKLENIPVLIVDDLGVEKGTEWELYMLYGLINNRSREMRTTIYTSNYSLEELSEKIQNDRIVSRIISSSLVINYIRMK